MNRKTIAAILILGAASAVIGTALWRQHAAEEARIVQINNTRFFQWDVGAKDSELLLKIKPNPRLPEGVAMPPVPRTGPIAIVAGPETTDPGAIVNIRNLRTGKTVGAYADEAGGFSLTMAAQEGDDLVILAMRPPAIIAPPAPVYVGLDQDSGQ